MVTLVVIWCTSVFYAIGLWQVWVTFVKQRLYFVDEVKKTVIMVSSSLLRDVNKFLSCATGIRNTYDLCHFVYYARFGIIPLLFKDISFSSLNKIKIYKIEKGSFVGFVKWYNINKKERVDVLLVDKENRSELTFNILSSKKIDEKTLKTIVGSVKVLE